MLVGTTSVQAMPAPSAVPTATEFRPAPQKPSYCWTRRDYAPTRDRFRGGCDAGSGIFQVEGVCYYFDGVYVTGQSIWYWAPAASPWFSCPSSEPFLYTVRLDFTRP